VVKQQVFLKQNQLKTYYQTFVEPI